MKCRLFLLLVCFSQLLMAQSPQFRFAFVTDTHIGSPNGSAEEDLRRTVRDINEQSDIAFVLLTGDITELGTDQELALAKSILDSLRVPWYIIPGNHDTGWSESGGLGFLRVFGSDRFSFDHQGVRFIGCASGPYVRMSDGHVPRDAVNWLDQELRNVPHDQLLVMVNHYPIDSSLDNWYEITDRIRTHRVWMTLCGHGHANKKMDVEGMPGIMGRSNLRAKATVGGYNIVQFAGDTVFFLERRPLLKTLPAWAAVPKPDGPVKASGPYPRPSYVINQRYAQVKRKWEYADGANIISTPATDGVHAVVGNQQGVIRCFLLRSGKQLWQYATGGPIYSSGVIAQGRVVMGSADGSVYALHAKTGKLLWRWQARAAVLGSPAVSGDTVFVGTSDHRIVALGIKEGHLLWSFDELQGPVVSTPLLYQGKLYLGAWDTYLYALRTDNGKLVWKWNNGSPVRNYSPASCIPVASDGVVYVVAPDRYVSALDAGTGQLYWRSRDAGLRESIGMSADGRWLYGKSMQDTVVAYAAVRAPQTAAWKMHAGFGYEHVPSMLIEKEGLVFFGTRNGVVYAVDPASKKVAWAHKIDNSMVNTVRVLDRQRLLATTMDGKLVLLTY